jgi:hypothetical protein
VIAARLTPHHLGGRGSVRAHSVRAVKPARMHGPLAFYSYASYRIEEVKSLPQVAWEMNTSERKLRDNYLELVSTKKLVKWKAIMPSSTLPKQSGESLKTARQPKNSAAD